MKKITFCLLLFLAMFQSQGQVLIGNGTTQKNLPINPYYGYTYSQSIYTAAEINATGQITGISWYYTGPAGNNIPNSQNLKVYLGHTAQTSFGSGSDWKSTEEMTEVYSGGITVNGPGWASITFTTPFSYNGTENLVVATAELQPMYDNSGDAFASHEVTGNRSIVYQNDGILPNLDEPQTGSLDNYVPNIIFSGIQKACPTPFFLNTAMTTSNSAMIVWGNSGPDNSSQYYYSEENVAPQSSTDPSGNSGPFAMVSDLNDDTLYYVWVRNICGGVPGEWSYSTSFRTECNIQSDLTENFDSTPANSLPACWSSIVRGPGVSSSTTALTFEGEAFSGPNSVRLFNSTTGNSADIILVSPKLSNLAANTHRLRFYADANNNSGLMIGTLNNNSSTATFTPLTGGTIDVSTQYEEYTIDFSSYTGTDSYIGFKLNTPNNYNPVSLDNIRWEPTPPCTDVSAINVENTQPTTAVINWQGTAGYAYEIAYDLTTGTSNPATLTPSAATEATTELSSLTPDTQYNVWVRSTCEGGVGSWVGPIKFRTPCTPISTLVENFDTATYPSLPSCWTSFIRVANETTSPGISITVSNSISAPNSVILNSGNYVTEETANDVILVSPKLNTVATGTHRLKFYAKGSANLEVGTISGTTNNALFTSLQDITVTSGYEEYTVDFSTYQGTDTYFAIRINSSNAYAYTYLENVKWEISPNCPDVSDIALQGVSPNSATISWQGGGESAWEIVYGNPETIDPSVLTTIVTSDSTTKEITDLEDNSFYAAWVRSVCGSDKGAWIGPISFQTACQAANTLTENFDAVETNQLPSCWQSIVRGTPSAPNGAFAKVTTNYVHSQSKSIQLYNPDQTDDNDVIVVSPNLGNLGAGTHRLRFYSSYHYPSSIQVGTLDGNTANAIFTPVQDIDINSTWTEYIIDFTQWSGLEHQYIGIRLSKNGVNSYAHIDDIIWEVAPSCPDVINVQISDVTTTDAYVYWEMGELDADAWQVSYAPSNVTDASTGTISEELSTEEFILDGLSPNTEYNVWVSSVCGELNGNWIGPIKFRTECVAGNTFNENFDTTATPSLPNCWSKIIRGNSSAQHFAYINNVGLGAHSGLNNITMFNSTYNALNDIILVSPPMENLAAGTHQLTFYLKGNTPNIEIGTLDNNTENAIFTLLTTVTATPTYTQYTIDFSGYEGLNTYIGIRHGGNSNTAISLDNISWEAIPLNNCTAVASINENFDTTAVEALPECWTAILRGPSEGDIDSIGVKQTGSVSAPNAVNFFKGMSGAQDDQILVLPQISNLGLGTHKLAFSHAGPPCQIEVGTLSDNTDTAVFTLKESVTVTGNWTQSIIDFTNYTGTDSYIGLRLNTSEAFLGMFIDDVIWSADLGNGTFNNAKFAYYPNPVKNILNLSYEQNITNVTVYNVLGQEIITNKSNANQTQVDMSGLASGTYIVKVTADNVNKTFKVVKE